MLEGMACHLGNHSGAKTQQGFSQKSFQVATGVGQIVEDVFNLFSNIDQPTIQRLRILLILVAAFGSPNLVVVQAYNFRYNRDACYCPPSGFTSQRKEMP